MPTHSPLIKICANTSQRDLQLAKDAGADFTGMVVEFPASPRHVSLQRARLMTSALPLIAVTVNLTLDQLLKVHQELNPYALQLHGDESPETVRQLTHRKIRVWKAVSGENAQKMAEAALDAGAEAVLVDSRARQAQQVIYGGTGLRSDWLLAKKLVHQGHRVILAGGLSPANVAEANGEVQPWMVDVVSGVEASPGIKDADKVRAFVHALR